MGMNFLHLSIVILCLCLNILLIYYQSCACVKISTSHVVVINMLTVINYVKHQSIFTCAEQQEELHNACFDEGLTLGLSILLHSK